MTLPLAPFGPRHATRGVVAAADQLAASAGIGLLAQRRLGRRRRRGRGHRDGGGGPAPVRSRGRRAGHGGAPAIVACRLAGDRTGGLGLRRGAAARRGPPGHARAPRHPQRAGPRRRGRLAGPARGLRPAAPRRGARPGDRAGRGRLRGVDHAGAGQPPGAHVRRRRRALPRRAARGRPARAPARPGAHAARHCRGRARRVLRGRVRPRPPRVGRWALRRGRLRHAVGAVVPAPATLRLGARPVDRAAALAGLPDPGRRRGGRDARPGRRPGGPRLGPSAGRGVARRRPRPPRRALRRGRRCGAAGARAPGRRRGAGLGGGRGATRRGAGTGHSGAGRGPSGRRGHDAPVRHRRRRARGLADAVQRARLRLASRRAGDRHLPAQPRRGLLAARGAPGRGGPGAPAAPHPVPHAGDVARGGTHAPGRRHGRRPAAADHQPVAGPPAARRPGPRHGGGGGAPGAGRAERRARSDCGGATT